MNDINVSIGDKEEQAVKTKEKIRKDIKKIDRFIKKAEMKIRSYEKQIETINSVSDDTKRQVALGLELLQKEKEGL